MIKGDMELKREVGRTKLHAAIEAHGGTTVAFTGMVGDDARLALAAIEAGARFVEPNHGDHSMAIGFRGVRSMHETVPIRDLMPADEMIKTVEGLRNVVGPEIFISVGAPGSFTAPVPVALSSETAMCLSRAGADCLHVHKVTMEDLIDVVEIAHGNGLLVDAYIAHPDDEHLFGIPADTPSLVAEIAREMEAAGADLIGLMTGMSYQGTAAGEITPWIQERLAALVRSIKVPTVAEGGINLENFEAFLNTGVNVLVSGTAINDVVKGAVRGVVETFLAR